MTSRQKADRAYLTFLPPLPTVAILKNFLWVCGQQIIFVQVLSFSPTPFIQGDKNRKIKQGLNPRPLSFPRRNHFNYLTMAPGAASFNIFLNSYTEHLYLSAQEDNGLGWNRTCLAGAASEYASHFTFTSQE